MPFSLLGCLVLSLAATPAPRKAASLAELRRDFAEGRFERLLERSEATLRATPDDAELAQVHLLRGQAQLAQGHADEAQAAFALAVKVWADVTLDEARAGPDAQRLFEKARAGVPATLSITVNGDAELRVGDRDLGPAPLAVQLPAGTHLVEARGAGGLVARSEVRLTPGRKTELALVLARPEPVAAPAPAPAELPPPRLVPAAAPAEVQQRSATSFGRAGLIPLAAGVVLLATGGVLLWQAQLKLDVLAKGTGITLEQEQAVMRDGPLLQTLGAAGVAVGALAVAAGAVMLVFAPSSPAQPVAFVTPGGGGVGLSGALP